MSEDIEIYLSDLIAWHELIIQRIQDLIEMMRDQD